MLCAPFLNVSAQKYSKTFPLCTTSSPREYYAVYCVAYKVSCTRPSQKGSWGNHAMPKLCLTSPTIRLLDFICIGSEIMIRVWGNA